MNRIRVAVFALAVALSAFAAFTPAQAEEEAKNCVFVKCSDSFGAYSCFSTTTELIADARRICGV